MRWWIVAALPFCIGAGEVPNSTLPVEIGVLSCTLGQRIDTPGADPSLLTPDLERRIHEYRSAYGGS